MPASSCIRYLCRPSLAYESSVETSLFLASPPTPSFFSWQYYSTTINQSLPSPEAYLLPKVRGLWLLSPVEAAVSPPGLEAGVEVRIPPAPWCCSSNISKLCPSLCLLMLLLSISCKHWKSMHVAYIVSSLTAPKSDRILGYLNIRVVDFPKHQHQSWASYSLEMLGKKGYRPSSSPYLCSPRDYQDQHSFSS